jgi:hypothetical protein
MSGRLRGGNNGEQDIELLDPVQRSNVERMDSGSGHMRKECDQRDEHEQSAKSCESNKCDCDPGTNATCICIRASAGNDCGSIPTRSAEHTSFPCAHCRDNDSTASVHVRKHKYDSITANRECNNTTDYLERIYTAYDIATSAEGESASSRVRGSDEHRDFKQADASSADSIERRIGIPAGVTI